MRRPAERSAAPLYAGMVGARCVCPEALCCSQPQSGTSTSSTNERDDVSVGAVPHGEDEWCSLCGGNGCEYGCGHKYGGCQSAYLGPDSHRICHKCKGSGRADIGGEAQ